jgi:SNF2 family DNA or RNA helicase
MYTECLLIFLTSLVFSHWGKTLNYVENGLNEHNIKAVKIDGSSTREQRGVIMQQFQEDRDVKVMLLTYASGSVGYVTPNHTIFSL